MKLKVDQIDQERVKKRIEEIHKRLRLLKKLEKENGEIKFLVDETIAAAAERHLQIALQACLDIADHLISAFNLELPKADKKEVFPILAQHGIIKQNLVKNLQNMAGMRNILVHEYTEVQREKIYHAIKYRLGDIKEFLRQIQTFLDRSIALQLPEIAKRPLSP